ncbi:hypothetical protein HDU98_005585 [Podochytrium sp. JEL0797]|nr:hypothetical protein HDU98_005585 [Podochytrium sp. JEL0797]
MSANDRDALESFRIKSEVSVNMVRQMIDDWLPKEPESAEPKSIRSTEGRTPRSHMPQLYNTYPGEAAAKNKKKKLESKIVAKKQEAAAERMALLVAQHDAEDSRTKSEKKDEGTSSNKSGSGIKRKGGSALDQYLNKKKKK